MNKQEIQTRLDEVQDAISMREVIISEAKTAEDELSDLTLEESQLELQLAKIEEEEELPTKPWCHADDEVDNDR